MLRSRAPLVRLVAMTAYCLAVTSCAHVESSGRDHSKSALIHSTAAGVAETHELPFDTTLTQRWNGANDGTTYEPCTALSPGGLFALGIVPDSVADAAATDGQTARGCSWKYVGSVGDHWTVSQIVGNSPSLEHEKKRASTSVDEWLPDVNIGGRIVGVHHLIIGGDCETYVQSGKAAVSTIVVTLDTGVPVSEICDRAIAFTRATIDKIPH